MDSRSLTQLQPAQSRLGTKPIWMYKPDTRHNPNTIIMVSSSGSVPLYTLVKLPLPIKFCREPICCSHKFSIKDPLFVHSWKLSPFFLLDFWSQQYAIWSQQYATRKQKNVNEEAVTQMITINLWELCFLFAAWEGEASNCIAGFPPQSLLFPRTEIALLGTNCPRNYWKIDRDRLGDGSLGRNLVFVQTSCFERDLVLEGLSMHSKMRRSCY